MCGSRTKTTATSAVHRLTQIGAAPVLAFDAINETMPVVVEAFVFSDKDVTF